MIMDLEPLNAAIDAAFAAALAQMPNPVRVPSQTIAPNVTLRTDTYVAPAGPGFRVACTVAVPSVNFRVVRVRNHGPDTVTERDWPEGGIEAAAREHVAACMAQAGAYVTGKGFNADRKVILLNKLLKVKDAGALAENPKLVSLYEWTEAVTAMALAGQTNFPAPPHTFEEVMAE